MQSAWTDDKILCLKGMVESGLSGRQIGESLGFSRSAIVAKCSRLGLRLLGGHGGRRSFTPSHNKQFIDLWKAGDFEGAATLLGLTSDNARRKAAKMGLITRATGWHYGRQHNKKTKPPTKPKLVIIQGLTPLDLTFMELESHHCRYPTSEQPPHLFCGHSKITGSSYCANHHSLCYQGVAVVQARVAA